MSKILIYIQIPFFFLFVFLSICCTRASAVVKDNEEQCLQLIAILDSIEDPGAILDVDRIIEVTDEVYAAARSQGCRRAAYRAVYTLSKAHYYAGNLKEALEAIDLIQQTPQVTQVPGYKVRMHQIKGKLLATVDLNDLALKAYKDGLAEADNIAFPDYLHLSKSRLYALIAGLYKQPHQADTLIYYIRLSQQYQDALPDDFVYIDNPELDLVKARHFIRNNQLGAAQRSIENLKSVVKETSYSYRPDIYACIGDYFKADNQLDSAHIYYSKAEVQALNLGVVHNLSRIYLKKKELFATTGQQDSLTFYHKLYLRQVNDESKLKLQAGEQLFDIVTQEVDQNRAPVKKKLFNLLWGALFLLVIAAWCSIRYQQKKLKKLHEDKAEKLQNKIIDPHSKDIIQLAYSKDLAFMAHFQAYYSEFWQRLLTIHPNLTSAEQHLCALTYLEIPTRDIAKIDGVEIRTIQTRRSRLRKKIELNSDTDLEIYLKAIGKEQQKNDPL